MKSTPKAELFRELPSVDELVRAPRFATVLEEHGATAVTDAIRSVIARLREQISSGLLDGAGLGLALEGLNGAVEAQLRRVLSFSLRPVINATGVILHTNLGRAPLSEEALAHVHEAAISYSNLEFDVVAGERGRSEEYTSELQSLRHLVCRLLL